MSKVKIQGNAGGTGIFTVAAPATNTDRTLTLPDVDATVMTTAGGTMTGQLNIQESGFGATVKLDNIGSGGKPWYLFSTMNAFTQGAGRFMVYHTDANSSYQLGVDSAGRVTMPLQPSFEVSQASLTAIDANNYYFTYSTIHHNQGSHYNSSNGRFTAPVTGVYLFQAVAMGVQITAPHIAFSINGTTSGGGGNYGSNNMWEHGSYSQNANWIRTVHIVKLTAGDYIRVQAYSYSSVTQPERCYFGGHLLG